MGILFARPCCSCGGETTDNETSAPVIDEKKSEEGLKTATFAIEGLSCSCEGEIIEKRIKSLQGITSFSLNPVTHQMKLAYDPLAVSIPDIEKSASKAGVKAVLLMTK